MSRLFEDRRVSITWLIPPNVSLIITFAKSENLCVCVCIYTHTYICGFPGSIAGKETSCNVGDLGSILGWEDSPGEENGYPLQYSGLENSMDCIVHVVTKSQTQPSNFHLTYIYTITSI